VATELIGWLAATILLATLGRQVYSQWRNGTSQGISKWLFTGQVSASTGFIVYSWLLANWVFVVTNGLILVTALLGQWVYLRNKRHDGGSASMGVSSESN
jgi:MtN3 and saliva related transmembrane protein